LRVPQRAQDGPKESDGHRQMLGSPAAWAISSAALMVLS